MIKHKALVGISTALISGALTLVTGFNAAPGHITPGHSQRSTSTWSTSTWSGATGLNINASSSTPNRSSWGTMLGAKW